MGRPSIALRAGSPSFDEGVALAHFLDEVSPGFRMVLGARHAEIVAAVYAQPGHALSYEHATFAVRDDAIVGVVTGCTAREQRESVGDVFKRMIPDRARHRLRAAFLATILRHFCADSEDDFYVWLLAVEEELRGQGIGSALMEHAEQQARAIGACRLSLDADAHGKQARGFYTHRGMTVVSRWPSLRIVPAFSVRMVKRL